MAARRAAAGLAPSPEADRSEFVRRIYFDVHGLPPTLEEAGSFLADESPDAYERLLDRLLASLRYGERWGRHWMDLADSLGHRRRSGESCRRKGDDHGSDDEVCGPWWAVLR